ncbi:terminase small subunit [Pararhodobacter zhoushanensis]|uniref:Terminase small subunit n=1 Tax=Pararhodobacter zhoushanensis TaxID=2479545 RepID=A0ABT3H438_9RHOB|nr:terminase small subunit [Pararhodobacter zhoushanensis]MCW1934546.1 terminase small subunit [Pararhodobacter zhoushanensis]
MAETETPALLPVDVADDLRAMLAAFPLPEGVADADMNQEEIAQAIGKTVNTVAKWTRAGMPVVQEGGQGRSYVYRLSHCWAWVNDREAREKAASAHNAAQVTALQAHFLGVDVAQPEATLTPKERKEMAMASVAWDQAARLKRSLVPLDEVIDLCDTLLTIVREGLDGLSDRLERELGLTPSQAGAVQRASADAINAMRVRIEDAELAERDGGDGFV